jgi:hypothetical protein
MPRPDLASRHAGAKRISTALPSPARMDARARQGGRRRWLRSLLQCHPPLSRISQADPSSTRKGRTRGHSLGIVDVLCFGRRLALGARRQVVRTAQVRRIPEPAPGRCSTSGSKKSELHPTKEDACTWYAAASVLSRLLDTDRQLVHVHSATTFHEQPAHEASDVSHDGWSSRSTFGKSCSATRVCCCKRYSCLPRREILRSPSSVGPNDTSRWTIN